jgi:serine/threonine-protein phosphatase 2A regulatory subunit B''
MSQKKVAHPQLMSLVEMEQARIKVVKYDKDGDGFLVEEDIIQYVKDLMPSFRKVNAMAESAKRLYPTYAARKFFFFLDLKKTRKIPVAQFLKVRLSFNL